MSRYRSAARRRLLSKAETRAAFLLQLEMLFGRSLITGGNAEVIQHSLELLRRKCVGRFWELSAHGDRNSHWHKAMPKLDPPHEMLEDISVAALALQYTRLRSWMECVAKQHGWHDFFTLEHVVVQRKDGQGCSFHVSVKDLRESSKWPSKYIPAVGSIVHSVNHGHDSISMSCRHLYMKFVVGKSGILCLPGICMCTCQRLLKVSQSLLGHCYSISGADIIEAAWARKGLLGQASLKRQA